MCNVMIQFLKKSFLAADVFYLISTEISSNFHVLWLLFHIKSHWWWLFGEIMSFFDIVHQFNSSIAEQQQQTDPN